MGNAGGQSGNDRDQKGSTSTTLHTLRHRGQYEHVTPLFAENQRG